MYGLSKIYKENTPFRPILSSIGSYNQQCTVWLTEILTPLRHHHFSVKDTFEFLDRIRHVKLHNQLMASLDVKSRFTNVPVDFTISFILNQVFLHGNKKFNDLTRLLQKKLLQRTCERTVFQFQGKPFEQIDGAAMGSPIALLLADVCMNWVTNQAMDVSRTAEKPNLLVRYVDDIFCIFPNQNTLEKFFYTITHLRPNIKFTKETEQDNQLAYLDVLVKRNNNNELETAVFCKKTHAGLYIKYSFLCPNTRDLMACLLHRAYQICNSYEIIHTEFDNITHKLLLNGYLLSFIQTQNRKFLNKRHNNVTQSQLINESSNQSSNRIILFRLPYIGNQSIQIEKKLLFFSQISH